MAVNGEQCLYRALGLFPKTNGVAYYLHDGRARSIEEAIYGIAAKDRKQKPNL
jgi:CxxC motif-containing protein (DUF1111 family)